VDFSPSFKQKIGQNFWTNQAKLTNYMAVNYFWLVNLNFLKEFKFRTWWGIGFEF
jgi:hypothetical protein